MNVEEHFLAAQTLVTEEVTYSQYDDEETEYKEYVNTNTSFTIRGVVLDALLT